MFAARVRLCQSYFFEGLPPPADADFTLSFGGGSLAEWKKRLWYGERGDDWEAQFVKGKFLNECFAPIISSCISPSPERHRVESASSIDVLQFAAGGARVCEFAQFSAERNTAEEQTNARFLFMRAVTAESNGFAIV